MAQATTNRKSRAYQTSVSAAGVTTWVIAALAIAEGFAWRERLVVLALIPVIIVVGTFAQHFRLPLGLKFTRDRVVFTLADAFILLVACSYGTSAAVFLAGIEGFTSSRRTVRRLSSNLFSSSMMSIGAVAASLSIRLVLQGGFRTEAGAGFDHDLLSVAIAMLVGGIVQITVNLGLFSTLFALRQDDKTLEVFTGFFSATPMFLPNSAAATLMYYALQHDLKILAVIGGPIFIAIYFGQRQYRDGIQKRIEVMEKAHRETIEALAVAINAKDEVTHEHVLRVQIYAAGVARILGCSPPEVEALRAGALLHDIGKIAVPDYIINKPGKLTAAEFEKMKIHTIAGARILSRVEFPYPIVPVVRHHHERWDGAGYPDGLSGENIPLTARILTVVDCFDAVREDRQYRKGMTRQEAIDLVLRGSGTQYDPTVVGTFIAHLSEFEAEISVHRGNPLPSFGIEASEQLSEAAKKVAPAAGLAEDEQADKQKGTSVSEDEMAAMCDLAQAVIGARSQDAVLAAFAEKVRLVVPHSMCAITLVDSKTGQNVVAHATGSHWMFLKGRVIGAGEGVTGWVLANRKPFCNTDPRLDLPPSVVEQNADYKTLAAFPIIKGSAKDSTKDSAKDSTKDSIMYGAVSIYSSTLDEYTAGHQKLMREAITMLASALSAVSEGAGWEKQLLPVSEDRDAQTALKDWIPDYDVTH